MPAVGNLKVFTIGGRTDSSGGSLSPDPEVDTEELRLAVMVGGLGPGVVPFSLNDRTVNPNAFRVRQSGSNMQVLVGSTVAKADGLILGGTVAGQGQYVLRLDSTATLTVPATDASNPRKYGIYAYVDDETYAGTADHAYAGLSCIAGTAAGSPTVPGPLSNWSAWDLLWSFQLAANYSGQVTNTLLDNTNAADGRTTASALGVNPLEFAVFL